MLAAVDHVQLAAPPGSEPQLRAYYTDVLGMTELPKPPALAARGGCWFRAGAVELHLGIEPGFRPALKAHPGLRVRDIEAYAERLASRGADVEWDDALPGRRRFYSSDPVGNRLEFLEAVAHTAKAPAPSGRARRGTGAFGRNVSQCFADRPPRR
ncbi:VOC family protein [Streptomyces sp. NPDC050659]|uniref:VOC family protein n=1 Tax=Streptomyces sp. NPDC050659 TaxID=3157215 RepID=UPI003422B3E9